MPVYEYRCKQCGKTHEIEHGFHDERPTACPACGGELVRVFHPIGLVFKGSGFHKTDYGGSSARRTGTSGTEPAPEKSDAKPSSDGKAGDARPSESPSKPPPSSTSGTSSGS